MTSAVAGESPSSRRLLIVVLASLTAFGPMSVDMYLPALPAIAHDLGADDAHVQLTLGAFFLGFGGGQLLYGPIADRFGRKVPLLAGLILFIAASVGCALSRSLDALIAFRLLQAMGGCAGPVLARAVVRDLYGRDQAARVLSLMVLIMGLAPLFAPLLGGQVLHFLGWRAIFWTLAAFGGACVAATVLVVPESLPFDRRHRGNVLSMVFRYGALLRHRGYLAYAFCGALVYGGMFAYLSGSPFVFITLYGVTPEHYGLLFGANVLGILGAAAINARIVIRFGVDRLLMAGLWLAALSGIALTSIAFVGWGGLPLLFAPLFFFIASTGFVGANSMAGALAIFPDRAGVASALIGTIQFGMGALATAILSIMSDGTARPMAGLIGLMGLLAIFLHFGLGRSTRGSS